ncbi:hypothetical protein ASD54_09590 [Rhizobium sp. Root149]|uniref:hypothetical protein n=1 Tax=Rhizobium sp. Root149 TaxID=1736473 RepID=UPI0007154024|nr:hypothetical protein [Rhizobium sp. Root149]KQZ50477.1 hypothetical protein ASD54_09590 [Rhizobium sp. Root149]
MLCLDWSVDVDEIGKHVSMPTARSAKAAHVQAVIVADAIMSARREPLRRISYSRRKGWWTESSRYRSREFTYDTVVPAVDALIAAGILVDHDLQPGGRATGIQSSYRPAAWLAGTSTPRLRRKPGELIRLKDSAGSLVSYRDTERTHRERKLVEKVNRLIADTEISLNAPDAHFDGELIRFGEHSVYPDMLSLYRVFNGSWTKGGRFYGGWWQSVKSKDRQHFILDGKRTTEVDYEQLHPRLLYALAGEHLDGDAYTLLGWDRKLCKIAFNVLLNASGYHEAHGALLPYLDGCEVSARDLIHDIKGRHPKVARYFHSGIGLRLQNVDSEMCRFVLAEMSVKKRITVLPVHDSFIVPETAKDELVVTMKTAFARATASIGDK